jgi:hypothetical protein
LKEKTGILKWKILLCTQEGLSKMVQICITEQERLELKKEAKRGQKRPSTINGENAREPWLTRELVRPVVMKT